MTSNAQPENFNHGLKIRFENVTEIIMALFITGWLASICNDVDKYNYIAWIIAFVFSLIFIRILIEFHKLQSNYEIPKGHNRRESQKYLVVFVLLSVILLLAYIPLYLYSSKVQSNIYIEMFVMVGVWIFLLVLLFHTIRVAYQTRIGGA
ncbi:MAG: hypothetical protein FP824_02460 [Euryarchaeota archaeon]|nr:hypothetical protein [Euryarchaeota archaeon]